MRYALFSRLLGCPRAARPMAVDGVLGAATLALLYGLWRGLPDVSWPRGPVEPPASEVKALECRCYVEFAPSSVVREHLLLLLVAAIAVFLAGACCGALAAVSFVRPRVHSNKTGRLGLYG